MDVSIKGSGPNENIEQQVDPTYQAGRVSLRPLEWQSNSGGAQGGHFGLAAETGLTTGIAAGGAIFSFRWTDSARVAVIHRILVGAVITTAYGTAQEVSADAVVVRGFTASDTGGTAISMSANSGKKRSNMASSLVGDLRIATTAALSAGTGTADTNAFGYWIAAGGGTAFNSIGSQSGMSPLFQPLPGMEHAVVLSQNEGFRVRIPFAQGASGVVRYAINVDWAEAPAY
jgi:hypothetical protein